MLIKRTEKDGIVNGIYESSNIIASEYNNETKDLSITFKNGGKYLYGNVQGKTFARFEEADSQGKILSSHIKNLHSFVNLGTVDIDLVNEELKIAKRESVASFGRLVIAQMQNIIDEYNESNVLLAEESLKTLDTVITRYKQEISK
jgi:hypothetical protein